MTTTWLLILFFHVGPIGDGNSNATTTAVFYDYKECVEAGKAAKKLTSGTVKETSFTCVKRSEPKIGGK